MKALRNILRDVLFQFRIKGALGARLAFVIRYYFYYASFRRTGLSQGRSRVKSYEKLAREGILGHIVRVQSRPGRWMELDVLSSWEMVKEILFDGMYFALDDFRPRPGQIVVDVGAHQGVFTLEAASLVGPCGKVVSIEASPRNFELLKKNIDSNKMNWVAAVHAAAMDFEGRATLHMSRLASGWNSAVLPIEGTSEKYDVEVPAETLDGILRRLGAERPDLIKIDAEGACAKILKGADATLAAKPRLVMEVEGGESELEAVCSLLASRGYRTTRFGFIVYASA